MVSRALLLLLLATPCLLFAADITLVYPRVPDPDVLFEYAAAYDSTFLFGNISPAKGLLTINGQPVNYDQRGAFLAYLPLQANSETNAWKLVLTEQGGAELARFVLPYRIATRNGTPKAAPDSLHYPCIGEVTSENAHTRTMPGGSYEFFPAVGTKIWITARTGIFFEFSLGAQVGVIESRFVTPCADSSIAPAVIGNGTVRREHERESIEFPLSHSTLLSTSLSDDKRRLTVALLNTKVAIDRIRYLRGSNSITNIEWQQHQNDAEIEVRLDSPLNKGYLVSTANGILQIEIAATFSGASGKLNGKTIVIDAGHGGSAIGATGPLGTQEKTVTLRWCAFLENELIKLGATVIQTRTDDRDLSLYDRIDIAREHNADFFLSLHANALPDGENPFLRRGCGTYYYQSGSRDAAERVQQELILATELNDDGIFDANFAVVRPSDFPALLIEGAYLMHPEEEQLLLQDNVLKKMSQAIAKGLKNYFKSAR